MNFPDKEGFAVGISNFEDVVFARQKVRELMRDEGFSLLDQTRGVTAVGELARNIVVHAERGVMTVRQVAKDQTQGIRCEFKDEGPGIPDVQLAMGNESASSYPLKLGLNSVRQLCPEFEIKTGVNCGTIVTIAIWKD